MVFVGPLEEKLVKFFGWEFKQLNEIENSNNLWLTINEMQKFGL